MLMLNTPAILPPKFVPAIQIQPMLMLNHALYRFWQRCNSIQIQPMLMLNSCVFRFAIYFYTIQIQPMLMLNMVGYERCRKTWQFKYNLC